ncbi:MAG: response regulator [Thermodesulfobacteriota bacterium]|nr:response regulator [Thermodesulfobacteriota bacterium]
MSESQVNILVLDDEESIRQSIAAYFEDEGFVVFQAASGEDGVAIVEKNRIDGAIVDIRLPGMDGNAFILKAAAKQPDMKFLVHTGSTDYLLSKAVKAVGVVPEDVFIKPVHDLSVLVNAIAKE